MLLMLKKHTREWMKHLPISSYLINFILSSNCYIAFTPTWTETNSTTQFSHRTTFSVLQMQIFISLRVNVSQQISAFCDVGLQVHVSPWDPQSGKKNKKTIFFSVYFLYSDIFIFDNENQSCKNILIYCLMYFFCCCYWQCNVPLKTISCFNALFKIQSF